MIVEFLTIHSHVEFLCAIKKIYWKLTSKNWQINTSKRNFLFSSSKNPILRQRKHQFSFISNVMLVIIKSFVIHGVENLIGIPWFNDFHLLLYFKIELCSFFNYCFILAQFFKINKNCSFTEGGREDIIMAWASFEHNISGITLWHIVELLGQKFWHYASDMALNLSNNRATELRSPQWRQKNRNW